MSTVLLLVAALVVVGACGEDLLAQTQYGWVRGVQQTNEDGVQFASFKGIPYAKQPLGELRFKELQSADPWEDIYNATTEGPVCPQKDYIYYSLMNPQSMSEACIHANVYTPLTALPSAGGTKLLPVLVFIHGGGFLVGSGDSDMHGPEYLMSEHVILVTFNYRLGALGFLSLNSPQVPGNNGLRDMLTLLRWVQDNIAAFGGDPDNVTLGGQSAGSVSAHLLTLSKQSAGLFKRAILISGTGPRSFVPYSSVYTETVNSLFMAGLGINSTDPEEIHTLLIQKPIEDIINVTSGILDQTGIAVFTPVVESVFEGVQTIIDEDPELLERGGRSKNIPLVIGSTNVECESFRHRIDYLDMVTLANANPSSVLPQNLLYSLNETRLTQATSALFEKYFSPEVTLQKIIDFLSYGMFQYPAMKLAQWRAEMGDAPVYLYSYEYNAEFSVLKETLNLTYTGAAHLEDQTYFLRPNHSLNGENLKNTDAKMRVLTTNFISNFMKYGCPYGDDASSYWPTVGDDFSYRKFTGPDHVISTLTTEQLELIEFWDNLRD